MKFRPIISKEDLSLLIHSLSAMPNQSHASHKLSLYLQSFLLKADSGDIAPAYIPTPSPSKHKTILDLGFSQPSALSAKPKEYVPPTDEEILAAEKALNELALSLAKQSSPEDSSNPLPPFPL